jgi:hypothetical protein
MPLHTEHEVYRGIELDSLDHIIDGTNACDPQIVAEAADRLMVA